MGKCKAHHIRITFTESAGVSGLSSSTQDSSPGIPPLSKPSGVHGVGAGGLLCVRYTHLNSFSVLLSNTYPLNSHPSLPRSGLLFHSSALSPSHFPWQRLSPFQNERLFSILVTQKSKGSFGTMTAMRSPWSCETLGHYYNCDSC